MKNSSEKQFKKKKSKKVFIIWGICLSLIISIGLIIFERYVNTKEEVEHSIEKNQKEVSLFEKKKEEEKLLKEKENLRNAQEEICRWEKL
ncbi:MAG: hypothetical protein E7214_02215 [Clostridium sp.]|nr:hypothetical protein [Clostridium sp.]